jgi:hypothetical protein
VFTSYVTAQPPRHECEGSRAVGQPADPPPGYRKNLLVFAAPLAAASLGRDEGLAYALLAAAALGLASVAVYFVNDVADAADAAPVFLWSVNAKGSVIAHSPGTPTLRTGLPAARAPRDGLAITANLGSLGPFRMKMTRVAGNWLIAGLSLAGDSHTQRLLLCEIIAGP